MGSLSDLERQGWNFNNKLLPHCGLHWIPQRKNDGDEEGGENDIFNTPVISAIIACVDRGLEI